MKLNAPIAPRQEHIWERPTGNIDDPWAWLRNKNDPNTIAYLDAENAYANQWFAQSEPSISTLFEEIKSRVQETDMSVPTQHGPWWYVSKTIEGMAYGVHCRGLTKETASENIILDENSEAGEEDYFSLGVAEISSDHSLLAWSFDTDGSEQYTMRIRNLADGTDLPDVLHDTSYGGTAFSANNQYLFYVVNDEALRPFRVMRHRMGEPQSTDVVVYEDLDERFFVGLGLTRSSNYIIIESSCRTTSEAHIIDAHAPLTSPICARPREEGLEYSIDDWGTTFVVLTNLNAEDFCVYSAPHDAPARWSIHSLNMSLGDALPILTRSKSSLLSTNGKMRNHTFVLSFPMLHNTSLQFSQSHMMLNSIATRSGPRVLCASSISRSLPPIPSPNTML